MFTLSILSSASARSVHNVRIERLWRDVTTGFGAKWKVFFQGLERHGLNNNIGAHIWLLHFLFLDALNQDAQSWADAWNSHVVARRGQPQRSPVDMFFFGQLSEGLRGADYQGGGHVGDNDPESFGIDWAELDDEGIRRHHDSHNAPHEQYDAQGPFVANHPIHYNHVQVDTVECPLNPQQLQALTEHLQSTEWFGRTDMDSQQMLWISALNYLSQPSVVT